MTEVSSDTILIAVDFTESTEYAIDHGCGFAKEMGFDVKILHVVPEKKEKHNYEEAKSTLEKFKSEITTKYGTECTYILERGDPLKLIGEVTKKVSAKYLFLGTRGKTGVEYIFGSYALKIIKSSKVPVFVVQKKGFINGYRSIIVPIDFTEESMQKLPEAIKMAELFNGTIHLLTLKEANEYYQRKLDENLSIAKQTIEKKGIAILESMSVTTEENSAVRTLKYAVSVKAELVIIMINTGGFFLPSVIDEQLDEKMIFNASQIPMLCINATRDIELNPDAFEDE